MSWIVAVCAGAVAAVLCTALLVTLARARRTAAAMSERIQELDREVAERRRTEVALRASEQRMRTLFDNAPVGVVHADGNGRIRQTNPGFCSITGRSESELAGMSLAELIHPDDRASVTHLLKLLAQAQPAALGHDWRMVDRSGQVRLGRAQLQLLSSDPDAGIVCVLEDVTERLQLREAEEARRIAEAANRAKSEFLSRMSHELRTPLNAMLGFAQLMELDTQSPLPPAQQERVEQIARAGWHLLEMINDMLDLSRIESGNLRLTLESLDVASAVQGAVKMVEAQAEQFGVIFDPTHWEPGQFVMADATRLKQILSNLLSNAIKYNRRGGHVSIQTRPHLDGRLAIDITDTGPGMSEAQLADLFQPFNRLGRERTGVEGTGIGLVISRRFAELMGGRLRARSKEGEGSTFTLTLPRAADAQEADWCQRALDHVQIDPLSSYSRRRVIYIEDNETNAEVMRGILAQRPQVEFDVYATGRDGLHAVRDEPPSLLLLDMHLPDISGAEVLRAIKDDPLTAAVPVVVVSADALAAQIDLAMHLGALRYLSKPVDVAQLLTIVDDVLGEQSTVW